jgi:uncharacterized protein
LRTSRSIGLSIAAVIIISAFLAPWCFWLTQSLGGWWTEVPFRRVFDRVLLVVAAVALWPLLRFSGVRSVSDLGYGHTRGWWRSVLVGYAVGVVSLATAAGWLIVSGSRQLKPALPIVELTVLLLKCTGTGLIVAVIEETFFRGGLQNLLTRASNYPVALLSTSAIYSAVHFLKPSTANLPAASVTWFTGFQYLGDVVIQSGRAPGVATGFVTLLLAGLILGRLYHTTQSLYPAIGLHAGWVFTLKMYAGLTEARGDALTKDPTTWPLLILLLFLVPNLCRSKQPSKT